MFNSLIIFLQKENYKRFYLALLRVIIGIYLLKEILLKSSSWDLLYSKQTLLQFNTHSVFAVSGIGDIFLKEHYLSVIISYIIALIFFIIGLGKNITAFIVFCLLFLLQRLNNAEVNGGDTLARFLIFYFIFANSFEYFSVQKSKANAVKNVVSNLAAYSMMIQLCIAYYFGFYNKVVNPYWQDGSAMYYIFNTHAYASSRLNQTLSQYNWLTVFFTYATLVLEASFPFLIWFKNCRTPLMIAGLLLHLSIYFLMMLYNLQIVFLSFYGLFFTHEEWMNFLKKRTNIIYRTFIK